MYGKCKDCAKLFSCFKPTGAKFGFCETDFEPKAKAEKEMEKVAGMAWAQLSSTEWEARGKYGTFRIKRFKGAYRSRYESEDTAFNLPPKDKLSAAKTMCEDNTNWEDVG